MYPEERRNSILRILAKKKFVTLSFLTESLFCSEATIRRDLSMLEKAGYIKRTTGGALFIREEYNEYPFNYKYQVNYDAKKHITDLAIDFIGNYQTIFLDSSSTCFHLARKIVELENLTVLCNGFPSCQVLAQNPKIKVYCPAGYIIHDGGTIIGESAIDYIETRTAEVAFISCRGIDADFGITDFIEGEAALKQAYRRRSKQVILLADSSKFGKSYFYQIITIDKIDVLITDKQPPEDILRKLEENDIECVY